MRDGREELTLDEWLEEATDDEWLDLLLPSLEISVDGLLAVAEYHADKALFDALMEALTQRERCRCCGREIVYYPGESRTFSDCATCRSWALALIAAAPMFVRNVVRGCEPVRAEPSTFLHGLLAWRRHFRRAFSSDQVRRWTVGSNS